MYETWGYDRDAQHWKSSEMMTKMLIDTVAKDGNFLLNIGPNARGEISFPTRSHLEAIGSWMHYHQQAIIGCGASSFQPPIDSRYTQNGNKLYLHLFSYPYKSLHLPGLAGRVKHIRFLHDGSELFYRGFDPEEVLTSTEAIINKEDLVLSLPVCPPDVLVPVVEITLREM